MEQLSPDNEALAEEIRHTLNQSVDTRPSPTEPYRPPEFAFAPQAYADRAAAKMREERDYLTGEIDRMARAMDEGYIRIEAEQTQIDAIALDKERAGEALAAINQQIAALDTASRKPADAVRTIEQARRPRRTRKTAKTEAQTE